MKKTKIRILVHVVILWIFRMSIQQMFMQFQLKILVSVISKSIFKIIYLIFLGDLNTIDRANQAKPSKEEPNEKALQALARRQRRLDGLQLFEKTKINR
jgi:hypothetical protein